MRRDRAERGRPARGAVPRRQSAGPAPGEERRHCHLRHSTLAAPRLAQACRVGRWHLSSCLERRQYPACRPRLRFGASTRACAWRMAHGAWRMSHVAWRISHVACRMSMSHSSVDAPVLLCRECLARWMKRDQRLVTLDEARPKSSRGQSQVLHKPVPRLRHCLLAPCGRPPGRLGVLHI